MKRIVTGILSFVVIIAIMAHSAGIAGQTGSPSETTCATIGCHNTYPLNSGSGSVAISSNIPASGYVPAQTYSISVTVAQTAVPLFGFDLEALSSSNTSAGTLAPINGQTQIIVAGNGRQNITHTTNAGLTTGSHTFTFNWTAPASSVGNVTFYAAGNAANNSNNAQGDYIYSTTRVYPPALLITGTISGSPFCAGQTNINVPFTVNGTFLSGNIFTAQLSDATGSFSSPTTLGTLTGTTSGTIVTTTPMPSVAGTLYRIRVIASNPATTGSDNGVNLTINLPPTISNAGPDQSICVNSTTLAGNTPSSGTGNWTRISGTGTITTASNPTSSVTSLGIGQDIFVWTISNGSCGTSTDTVIITVNAAPTTANAGPDQTVCANFATLSGNTPSVGTGNWSLISGTGTITNATNPSTTVTGLGAGNTIFQWTITNGSCTSSDQVVINFSGSITIANAGPDQNICSTSTTLAGNTAINGTGTWTLVSGAGSITTPPSPTSTVTGLGSGANIFVWTITNGVCTPTTDTVIITSVPPQIANAGPDQNVCANSTTLAGNTPSSGSGTWTLIAGSGIITTASNPATTVTSLAAGANKFVWTISNPPCSISSDTVIINQSGSLTTANAGPDQNICGTSATLAGNTPISGTGMWTLISGSGTITNPASPTSTVTALGQGNNVFAWTISNMSCTPSVDNVTIAASYPPTNAVAGPDQTICNTTATMNANSPLFGTGSWSVISGSGVFTNPSSPTTVVTSVGNGVNIYRWTISNPPCTSTFSDVTINNCTSISITTGTINGSPFCATTSYSVLVPFTFTGTFSGFYSAELSDASGSFASPVVIGSGSSSPISAVIPSGTLSGSGYRIRVTNSNPVFAGADNGVNLSINNCVPNTITTSVISGSPFCINTTYNVSVPFTSTGIFSGTFTAELSDATGSFANAVPIGTGTSSPIASIIPSNTTAGYGYLIRVINNNPLTTGSDNGTPFSINTCSAIITDTINGSPFCSTTSYNVSVPFEIIGNVNGPFSVQLSDASGSFSNPLVIGYGYSSPIAATIPSGAPYGINYRMRVVTNIIQGTDNGENLQINNCVVGIDTNNLISRINIYPNPNNGTFYLQTQFDINEKVNVEVTDILGQKVSGYELDELKKDKTVTMQVPEKSGFYFVKITWGNSMITTPVIIE